LAAGIKPVRDGATGDSALTEEQKRKLEQKLWDIANTLRGKMDADEFRDYILGFIFYKYLSEKMYRYANKIVATDNVE